MDKAASVEVSSEDENYPIESALLGDEKRGWCAAEPGVRRYGSFSTARKGSDVFSWPSKKAKSLRTQEFVLRWSSHLGQPFREIVRQQWNFSSPGGIHEIEDYAVDLFDVGVLELISVPDKGGGETLASLVKMRLAA